MKKSYAEINKRVAEGNAVILTKEEFLAKVIDVGVERAAEEVDVVTTATFGPMCSSGAFLNICHTKPRIKVGGGTVYLNGVPAYTGLAAVDVYLGATAMPDEDPRNSAGKGKFEYGGGHVIHDLLAGKDIVLKAKTYGTDCYPRKELETRIALKDMNEAMLCSPRNAYQNYNCAVNLSDKPIYTYMGILKPNLENAHFCSAAQLSPLMNDPLYRTIGIGTRIFLGGGVGYVFSAGTQHNPETKRFENGTPKAPAGTLAVTGDLKQMRPEWLVGISYPGYGPTMRVGIGVPIPMLDVEMAKFASVTDDKIFTQIVDYSDAYPNCVPGSLGEVSYAQLRTGKLEVNGKQVPASNLSSYEKAKEISGILKGWIATGKFALTEPVQGIPTAGSGYSPKPLKERPVG